MAHQSTVGLWQTSRLPMKNTQVSPPLHDEFIDVRR